MRADALVHTSHVGGAQRRATLEPLFASLDCALVCGMAPDAAADDHTLALYQRTGSSARRAALFPALCGFRADDPGVLRYAQARERQYPGLWRALGEVFARKERPGWTAPVSPAACAPLWDAAAALRLPVWLHHDLRGPSDALELGRALSALPPAAPGVVLCHAGVPWRAAGAADAAETGPLGAFGACAALMRQHPRLHADLSWSALRAGEDDPDAFRRFLLAFPERTLLGSDAVPPEGPEDAQRRLAPLLRPVLRWAQPACSGTLQRVVRAP